jgi:hypothetical protein
MIKKILVPLGGFPIKEIKREVKKEINYEEEIFKGGIGDIKSMKIVDRGHELFNNGFKGRK